MAKKKFSALRWFKILVVLALIYVAVFFGWSRARTFRVSGDNHTMWSFFEVPRGFQLAVPNTWRKWKECERIAATIFWPCIQLDERWTNRRYWPAAANNPTRLL